MPGDVFNRAAKRSLNRLGRDVTLVNQSAQVDGSGDPERDDYGDIEWDTEQTSSITAELVSRGTPQFDRRADGIDDTTDIVAWVDDSETITDGSESGATRATRLEVTGERYVVRETFDEDNGLIRAHGEKE